MARNSRIGFAFVAPAVLALVGAVSCARGVPRDASPDESPPFIAIPAAPISSPANPAPSAIGGGPPTDAEVAPTFPLDASAVLKESPIVAPVGKGDAQADGPSGGTYGASSDNGSPGAAGEAEHSAGVTEQQP